MSSPQECARQAEEILRSINIHSMSTEQQEALVKQANAWTKLAELRKMR